MLEMGDPHPQFFATANHVLVPHCSASCFRQPIAGYVAQALKTMALLAEEGFTDGNAEMTQALPKRTCASHAAWHIRLPRCFPSAKKHIGSSKNTCCKFQEHQM